MKQNAKTVNRQNICSQSYGFWSENKGLKDNEDAQGDLLSITAHELRTPLQTILVYVEMILADAQYREFDQQNG